MSCNYPDVLFYSLLISGIKTNFFFLLERLLGNIDSLCSFSLSTSNESACLVAGAYGCVQKLDGSIHCCWYLVHPICGHPCLTMAITSLPSLFPQPANSGRLSCHQRNVCTNHPLSSVFSESSVVPNLPVRAKVFTVTSGS